MAHPLSIPFLSSFMFGVLFATTCNAQSLTIAAPTASVNATNVIGSESTEFTPQVWSLSSQSNTGASASFEVNAPFVATNDSNEKHNVQLALAAPSNSGVFPWFLVTASDSTDFQNGKNSATVTVSCDGPAVATIGLTVRFLSPSGDGVPSAGQHTTTVVGTIWSN